jgi:hypothetical protein
LTRIGSLPRGALPPTVHYHVTRLERNAKLVMQQNERF